MGLSNEQLKGKKAYVPEWQFTDFNNRILLNEEYPVNLTQRTKLETVSGFGRKPFNKSD